jgi:hypothetical protein
LADHQLDCNQFNNTVKYTREDTLGKAKNIDPTEYFLSENVAEVRSQNSNIDSVSFDMNILGKSIGVIQQHDIDVSILVVTTEILSIVVDVCPSLED